MENYQNVINAILAFIIALLIYYTTQLQNKVELLEIYAQQDTDRIEALEEKLNKDLKQLADNVEAKFKSDDENFKYLLEINEEFEEIVGLTFEVAQQNFDLNEAKITQLQEYLFEIDNNIEIMQSNIETLEVNTEIAGTYYDNVD